MDKNPSAHSVFRGGSFFTANSEEPNKKLDWAIQSSFARPGEIAKRHPSPNSMESKSTSSNFRTDDGIGLLQQVISHAN